MPTETRQATKLISFRLTPEDDRAVRAAAEARGMGPSSFAAASVLRAAGRPAPVAKRRKGPDALPLARLHGEMGRIGGLLKVLTLQARDGRVPPEALREVRQEWEALRDLILDRAGAEETPAP